MTNRKSGRATLNSSEVAKLFDITRATLYRWVRLGKIPEPMTHPTTGQMIWTQTDLDNIGRFLRSREQEKRRDDQNYGF